MTNRTADTTKQVKTLVASPLLITEIEDKYKDLADKYNAADLEFRTLSNTWQERVSAKAIGLLGLLAYWSARNMDFDGYSVARINPIWIARKLGYAEKQASRHVKQIQALLLELHHAELIKINRPDKQTKTQTIKIINAKDQANGYCKLYSPTIHTILEQSKDMTTLNRVAIYVAMRSITFENTNATMTKTPNYLANMLGLSVKTVQKHLTWLRDSGALCWFKLVLDNEYHTVKYVYSDPVNAKDLTAWTIDHLIVKDPRMKHYIAKVVA